MNKKKKIIFLVSLVLILLIGYFSFYFYVKNNIVFHSFDGEVTLLWGQNAEERKSDFYHLKKGNSDNYKYQLLYDADKVNEVQNLTVKVSYFGVTSSKNFKLVIIDKEKPIIKYTNDNNKVNEDFDIEEHLEVYDQRAFDQQIFYIDKEDYNNKYYGKKGYCYYTNGNNKTYDLKKGLNKIHILAWDGHGNETSKTIELFVE